MGRARVWAINPRDHMDFTDAGRFGDVRIAFDGRHSAFQTTMMQAQVLEWLEGTAPSDYLILGGNSMLNALAFAAWVARHGVALVLIYGRQSAAYEPREITRASLRKPDKEEVAA